MIVHGVELNIDRPGRVLLVARDWGEYEEIERRPLIGPAGVLFDEVLAYGGWRRQDCNITNVVPETRPPYDDFRKHREEDVRAGRAALDKLVKRLKPSLIITMGNEAAYHFVEGWPTGGRGIFGAKGIEDRRGYFWETKYGWVLTLLHPAGAARKIVPGYELLRRDFQRARQWSRGLLPRQEFPEVRTLASMTQANALLRNAVLAADIETHWSKVFCCGFTGDDYQPYVAKYGRGFTFMREVLHGRKGLRGVFHNGPYDVDLLDREDYPTTLYTDDTQTAWGNALEPELAFHDEEDKGRLTRKGLASLASLCPGLNVPFWKASYPRYSHPTYTSGYPDETSEDPNELAKLYTMAGRDTFITRKLWDWLWPQVRKRQVEPQYRLAFETNLRCITMTRRGWPVDEALRAERLKILKARSDEAKAESTKAALAYITKHKLAAFQWTKECQCCHGVGERCWRCAGLKQMPKKKEEYAAILDDWEQYTVADLKEKLLPPCKTCGASGQVSGYAFNPYSRDQLVALFYDHIGAPQWVFKGKVKMDEMANLRLLQWAEGGKIK